MELSSSIRDIHLSNPAALSRSKSSTSLFGFRRSNPSVVRRADNNKRFSWFGGPVSHISSQLTAGTSRLPPAERACAGGGGGAASSAPGPQRTMALIRTASRAVREAVSLTERNTQAPSLADDAPDKTEHAEKYLKKLTYFLGLLEEIHEAYTVEHKMREGVRAIGRAYVHSDGPERDAALGEVKLGLKGCDQQLSALEGHLESLMGVLHVQMKGLQGFARLCAGDVFEVHMKMGSQKWRTKGRIGRDGTQQWDSTLRSFRVPISHLLYIRVTEIRTLGKQVLLGNKYCETLDLLSTQPQLMTINLSLSLRLNLVVTWDPLAGLAKTPSRLGADSRSKSASSLSVRSSYLANKSAGLARQSSFEELSDHAQDKDLDEAPEKDESNDGSDSGSPVETPLPRRSSQEEALAKTGVPSKSNENFLLVRRNDGPDWWQNKLYSSPTHTIDSGYDDSFRASSKKRTVIGPMDEPEYENGNLNWQSNVMMRKKQTDESDESRTCSALGHDAIAPASRAWPGRPASALDSLGAGEKAHRHRGDDWSAGKWRLESVLAYLNGTIADIQGQYADLETFERSVAALYQRLMIQQGKGANRSSALSLEISDVMESFDFLDSEDTQSSSHYESLDNSLEEAKIVFTPQLDETLLIHLSYCRHLVDELGSYGPLKCRERQAVKKLQVQGRILNKLSKLIERWQNNPSTKLAVFEELHGLPHLQRLWETACSGTRSLYVTAGAAVAKLSPLTELTHVPKDRLDKVMQRLVARCQDVAGFDAESRLTVFQFRYYVRSKERSFQARVEEINSEIETVEALDSGKQFVIQKTITRLSLVGLLPASSVLLRMSHFLLDLSDDRENPRVLVASYLRNTAKDNDLRQKLVDAFFEGLESYEALDRQGSCCALGVLKEEQAIEALAYLVQSDKSRLVRETAKRALQNFGERGQEMLQQLQLSSYGFQGVNIA